jgi:hypothetical protein
VPIVFSDVCFDQLENARSLVFFPTVNAKAALPLLALAAKTRKDGQMVQLTADGRYRGAGGPEPKKPRAVREEELLWMMPTLDGRDIILALWKEAKGIPFGTCAPIGTSLRQEMIPDILAHEYPHA